MYDVNMDTTRVTFNLNRHGNENLDYIQRAELVNRTDAIHRALKLYTFLLMEQAAGQEVFLRNRAGELAKLTWA
jgi:hypothetical protein